MTGMAPASGTHPRPARSHRAWSGVGVAVLGICVLVNGVVGAAPVPVAEVVGALGAPFGLGTAPAPGHDAILWAVRFPRNGLGLLVGAALAVGGALLQGVFRNPLADPGVLGVSGGAALGAAAVQVFGGAAIAEGLPEPLRPLVLAIGAFTGAVAAAVLVAGIAGRDGITTNDGLLLAGIAVSAGAASLLSILLWIADDAALRGVTTWLMGSLGGATGGVLLGVAPLIGLPLALAPTLARRLDALLLGETEAAHLGVDPSRVRWQVLGLSAVLVGTAVAVAGAIGFVGLVVPQMVRLGLGATHRVVLVGSLVAGPILVLTADLAARTLAAPAEIPIGVFTSLVGTPVFVWLLRRGIR